MGLAAIIAERRAFGHGAPHPSLTILPCTYFPFGGGVRHCLGAAFATFEAKIVLARVLSRMILRPDPGHAIRVVRRGLALGPSSGLPVTGTAAGR